MQNGEISHLFDVADYFKILFHTLKARIIMVIPATHHFNALGGHRESDEVRNKTHGFWTLLHRHCE